MSKWKHRIEIIRSDQTSRNGIALGVAHRWRWEIRTTTNVSLLTSTRQDYKSEYACCCAARRFARIYGLRFDDPIIKCAARMPGTVRRKS